MDDFAFPICKDVERVKAKGRRIARPEYVTCYLALAAVLLSHQPVMGMSKRSVADERPRLIIHPLPQNVTDSKLIWYRANDPTIYNVLIHELNRFTEKYYLASLNEGSQTVQNCNYDNPPSKGKVCLVNAFSWGPCSNENSYHYNTAAPCLFLEMNQPLGWVPDYYNRTSDLPETMPADLKYHIATLEKKRSNYLNTMWITCECENPTDVWIILYHPICGFPGYFYPRENIAGYLNPVVAVKLIVPRTEVVIRMECKAWAKNINHDLHEGLVRFDLRIDFIEWKSVE